MRLTIVCIALLALAVSCNTLDIYEKTVFFPQHSWKNSEHPSFTFDIKDTSSLYNVYVVIRHEDAYRYRNIWLSVQVKTGDSAYTIRREFQLAANDRWLGSSMDDIIEHRMIFNRTPISLRKGRYVFTLEEIMREEPLQHVLNAGIRLEKAHP